MLVNEASESDAQRARLLGEARGHSRFLVERCIERAVRACAGGKDEESERAKASWREGEEHGASLSLHYQVSSPAPLWLFAHSLPVTGS